MGRRAEILLVEDNPGDQILTVEALREGAWANPPHVVQDGEAALQFLHREGAFSHSPRPDLVILDLNLPKKDGREVLSEMKADPRLQRIPVVVLTSSSSKEDQTRTAALGADCFLTKPSELDAFFSVVRGIERFWTSLERVNFPNCERTPGVLGPGFDRRQSSSEHLYYLWILIVLSIVLMLTFANNVIVR